MICKLCLNDRELQNSHIVPEFVYKPLYDEKHRALRISTADEKTEKIIQKGIRELLLCRDCEQLFCSFESYFAETWLNQEKIPDDLSRSKQYLYIRDLDYKQFKLFHMSVLWRAGVSKLPEFSAVSLGPHCDKMRKMLLESYPGEINNYPILAQYLIHDKTGRACKDIIFPPRRLRIESHTIYAFVFASCVWHYVVSSHSVAEGSADVLKPTGSIRLQRQPFRSFKLAKVFFDELFSKHPNYLDP